MPILHGQKELEGAFKKSRILELKDLFQIVQTKSRMTVFRRLEQLGYYSSYTHAGRFYTLKKIPRFNTYGLWFWGDIGFSTHRSLKETIRFLVRTSETGRFHAELENQLKTRVQNVLLELVKKKQIGRIKIGGKYLYTSIEPVIKKQQLERRKSTMTATSSEQLVYSKTLDIEILAETIRQSSKQLDIRSVLLGLSKRGFYLTEQEIKVVFQRYDIKKKTPDSR